MNKRLRKKKENKVKEIKQVSPKARKAAVINEDFAKAVDDMILGGEIRREQFDNVLYASDIKASCLNFGVNIEHDKKVYSDGLRASLIIVDEKHEIEQHIGVLKKIKKLVYRLLNYIKSCDKLKM